MAEGRLRENTHHMKAKGASHSARYHLDGTQPIYDIDSTAGCKKSGPDRFLSSSAKGRTKLRDALRTTCSKIVAGQPSASSCSSNGPLGSAIGGMYSLICLQNNLLYPSCTAQSLTAAQIIYRRRRSRPLYTIGQLPFRNNYFTSANR
jgi:hypothetical protein